MATNPYSYGSLGARWTVGEPTSKSLLDISRVKADANRWTLEQLIPDPDTTQTLGFDLSFSSSSQRLLQIYNASASNYFQIFGGRAASSTSDYLVFSTGTNGTIMEFDGANHWITFHDTAGVQKMYYRGSGGAALILESGVDLTVGGTGTFSGDLAVDTDTLYVDASADRVGVNNASPSQALDVVGDVIIDNGTTSTLYFDTNTNWMQLISGYFRLGLNSKELARFTQSNGSGGLTLKSNAGNDLIFMGPEGSGGFEEKLLLRGYNSGTISFEIGHSAPNYINTGQNFGIGTSSPVAQNVLTLQDNTNGYVGIRFNGTGSYAHNWSLYGSGDGAGNEFFGLYDATNGAYRVKVDESGNVLIGYASSNGSYKLQVNSQIFATNATIATSDGRYKEDVQTLSNATDLVTRLNPVQFKWKAHEIHNLDVGKTDVGFIAQEVQEVLSDTDYSDSVVVANKVDDEKYLGLGETKLIPLLTAALQEAIAKIETLETKVAALEAA